MHSTYTHPPALLAAASIAIYTHSTSLAGYTTKRERAIAPPLYAVRRKTPPRSATGNGSLATPADMLHTAFAALRHFSAAFW
ncbi:hypothetical protein NPIL_593881 [Nephila pilipes]|uniref:Uncharacterized protein n=1 Tax=Nephila pilipes TaxID=299642 RepID=A0A8X6NM89_NEPPI|nr:hypothetical protein NPIL_593881 [Nephila pilipes]